MKRNLSLAIVHLLHTAKKHIQYPKIRLQFRENLPLQLSVAGDKAKNPGSINITDGKPYGESQFYGRIHKDGTTMFNKNVGTFTITDVQEQLEKFADDPAGYAKLYSNGTGNCMFCCKQLTDPQSVVVGYGPVCAAHYNLPHGDVKNADAINEVEHDLAEFDLEMPKTDHGVLADMRIDMADEIIESDADKIADLQLRVERLEKLLEKCNAI